MGGRVGDDISGVDRKEELEFPTAGSFDKLEAGKEQRPNPKNESALGDMPELIEIEECLEMEEPDTWHEHRTTLCPPHCLKCRRTVNDLPEQAQNAPQIALLNARLSNVFARMQDIEKKISQSRALDVDWTSLTTLKSDFDIYRQISSSKQFHFEKYMAEALKVQETRLETARRWSDDKIWNECQAIRESIKTLSTAVKHETQSYIGISEICDKPQHSVKVIQEDRQAENRYDVYHVQFLSKALHSLDDNIADLRKKTWGIADWLDTVDLLTRTTNAALDSVHGLIAKFEEFENNVWVPKLEAINETLQTSINQVMQMDHRLAIVEEKVPKTMLRESTVSKGQDQVMKKDKTDDSHILESLEAVENSAFPLSDQLGDARVKTFPAKLDKLSDQVDTHSSMLCQLRDCQLETVRHCKPLIGKTETLAQQTTALETLTDLEFQELRRDQSDVHNGLLELKRQFEISLTTLKQTVQKSIHGTLSQVQPDCVSLRDEVKNKFESLVREQGDNHSFAMDSTQGECVLMQDIDEKIKGLNRK